MKNFRNRWQWLAGWKWLVSSGHQEAAVSWYLLEGDWMISIGFETERMVSTLLGEKEGGRTRRTKERAMQLIYN